MASIEAQELGARTSEVLRRVREDGETIDVTHRGKVVARVVPAEPKRLDPEKVAAWWREWDDLADEVSKHWPEGLSAVDAVRAERRDL